MLACLLVHIQKLSFAFSTGSKAEASKMADANITPILIIPCFNYSSGHHRRIHKNNLNRIKKIIIMITAMNENNNPNNRFNSDNGDNNGQDGAPQ